MTISHNHTTEEKQDAFLKRLAEGATITDAVGVAKVHRRTVYDWREANPDFKAKWDEIWEARVDDVEQSLFKANDTTARIFVLKAWRPERYGQTDNRWTQNIQVHQGVTVQAPQDPAQLAQAVRILIEAGALKMEDVLPQLPSANGRHAAT